jgi:hypothetical protein
MWPVLVLAAHHRQTMTYEQFAKLIGIYPPPALAQLLEWASFDSRSAGLRGGSFRTLLVLAAYGFDVLKERFRDTGGRDRRARDYMLRDCTCESCGFLRQDVWDDSDLINAESYLYHRMMFDNVIITLGHYRRLHTRYRINSTARYAGG